MDEVSKDVFIEVVLKIEPGRLINLYFGSVTRRSHLPVEVNKVSSKGVVPYDNILNLSHD